MKDSLNILIIGIGGRENALAATMLKSNRCARLYAAPGQVEGALSVDISALDFPALARFISDNDIDMVTVGPEAPIVEGIYDALSPTGAKIIAPDKECARLEGSKEFAKEFMIRHAIPSPRFMTVTADTLDEGLGYIDSLQPPYVLKADGLAAGRGVFISDSMADAKDMLSQMLEGLYGESSSTVVIEEHALGKECSVFLAVDGEDYIILPSAKDYKRLLDGDGGPNTAGLGAMSPAECIDEEFMAKVTRRIIEPTLRGLKEEGLDYRGFLYLGLMNCGGDPLLLEYNVRLGDPESQVILPLIKSDFIDLLEGIADRTLALKRLETIPRKAVGIVLAAKGYPGPPAKGDAVRGLETARSLGCLVFEGALGTTPDGSLITDGGRIATVVAVADDLAEARCRAMRGAEAIDFEGKYFRKDIGLDL
ncbi:MAG: phosphoribosylamine--glycine ligase [Muribaculum sp.]|nr:phosphoribosylamine--glycine ligase [Muribaculum sp.]